MGSQLNNQMSFAGTTEQLRMCAHRKVTKWRLYFYCDSQFDVACSCTQNHEDTTCQLRSGSLASPSAVQLRSCVVVEFVEECKIFLFAFVQGITHSLTHCGAVCHLLFITRWGAISVQAAQPQYNSSLVLVPTEVTTPPMHVCTVYCSLYFQWFCQQIVGFLSHRGCRLHWLSLVCFLTLAKIANFIYILFIPTFRLTLVHMSSSGNGKTSTKLEGKTMARYRQQKSMTL